MDQIDIMSESVIKVENVKLETDDHPEDEAYDIAEGGELCPLKRELEEVDEEELKPPIRVFLDPEEVPSGEESQEDKDPLALGTEFLLRKEEQSAGGGCDTVGDLLDSMTQMPNAVSGTSSFNDGNYTTLGERRVRERESPVCNELTVCATNLLESGCEVEIKQKEDGNERKSLKKSHIQTQSADRSNQCSFCQKTFTEESSLLKHMRIHSGGERPHICSVCQKSFTRSTSLADHMRIHRYDCSVCQKRFTERDNLVEHMRIHIGECRNKCSVCQKSFTESSYLDRHMRKHSGERPHVCSVCQKGFIYRSSLFSHMRIHSGVRPHKCSVCQKSFTQRDSLVRHMRIHSGERPYKCSICQKTFTLSNHLIQHMRMHSGERPHKCSVCQKSFSESSNAIRHMRIHRDLVY